MLNRARSAFWGSLVPATLLVVWQVAGSFDLLPRYLPTPGAILAQLWSMILDGELAGHASASLYRALAGFVIGSLLGLFAGMLAATMRGVERFIDPLVSLTYPIPKVAALPIIFAWFGLGDASKIVTITISVVYPVYIAVYSGAKTTPRVRIWAARNMGAGPLAIMWRVLLPSALPQIFSGLRIAMALSLVVMFVAELVSSSRGLGYLTVFAEDNLRFDIMYVAIISIGALGFVADRLLLAVQRRMLAGTQS